VTYIQRWSRHTVHRAGICIAGGKVFGPVESFAIGQKKSLEDIGEKVIKGALNKL
jgi:hypothetical protein